MAAMIAEYGRSGVDFFGDGSWNCRVARWELTPGRLRYHRRVASRYDRLAVCYETTVLISAINEWL